VWSEPFHNSYSLPILKRGSGEKEGKKAKNRGLIREQANDWFQTAIESLDLGEAG